MKKIVFSMMFVMSISLIGLGSTIEVGQGQVQIQQKPRQIEQPQLERKTPQVEKKKIVAPSRVQFAEPNNSSGNAYLLTGFGKSLRFLAGFSNSNDVDYYKVRAASQGFGSWFRIDVESSEPSEFDLFVELLGPDGSVLEHISYEASGSLWIALKSGVEAKIKIAPGDSWSNREYVYYDIGLTKGVIDDKMENDDTKGRAKLLTYGGTKTAYMCGVLDRNGEAIGLDDWFQYNHKPCRNDCLTVSQSAYLEICRSPNPDDCTGCSNDGEGNRVCLSNGCDGDGWGPAAGVRYVLVRPSWSDENPYGHGGVPGYYTSPYKISLSDSGFASFDEDCTNP